MIQPPGRDSLLDTAADRFHDLVIADPRLAPWFDDAALDRLTAHLVTALASVGIEDGHLDDVRQVVEDLRDQVVEV